MQHAHRITRLSALALGITGALALGQVHASGFQLKENSVKGLGSAFAGAGVKTGDTAVVVNNPATMTQFEGTAAQFDVTMIDLNYEFQGSGSDVLGRPLSGGDGGNAGDFTPIPAFSLVHKFDNGTAIGAMVSAPFGLATKYDNDWVGRYYAVESDVKIVELALSGAVDIIPDRLSVGLGLTFSKADVTLSKGVDFGTALMGAGVPGFLPQGADGFAEVQGDDTGMGWIAGVNFRPTDKLSIGLNHRSEVKYDLSGKVDWTVPAPARATFDAVGRGAFFVDGDASAKLTTPGMTTVDVNYQFTDRFSMAATYSETKWESLREVRINFAGPDPDSVEPFEWSETRFASIGGEYKFSDAWTFRAGYAYDETPTTFAHRTPRLPDEDRQWYSVGATWNFSPNLEFSLAYTRLEPDTPKIGIITAPQAGGQRLFGEFDGGADLYGISAQYKF
ncbi:porin [Lysobacter sp. CW239]|uniref:OmpP1/FadL family transporter n=1 Tax=Lysobacteraceae TaxID=32033 RepID=UPI0006898A29|nr:MULTISPECIES: porin [Lysobacter]QOD90935.1 porin [Lysobacter sp. CW239]